VTSAESGQTLQDFLREKRGLSMRQTKALIDARNVYVNGQRIWMARHALRPGDRVQAPTLPPPAAPKDLPPALLHEDEWLIAYDKAPGIVCDEHPASAEALLRAKLNLPTLRALHRLDRDTSGVLLFTRREEDREPYVDLFRQHQIHKTYQALVRGRPDKNRFRIDTRLDGKEALTDVSVLGRHGNYCRLACSIPTGRTHQIRRHLAEVGCVLVGERHYAQQGPAPEIERSIARQMLHAAEVSFTCPHLGSPLQIRSPLPADFKEALKRFGL
jgi:23S rRNA pseudouridine1911/1915/1917 synthase